MTKQYKRRVSLLVKNLERALDLSELQFQFEVYQSDFQTPNYAVIKVFNMADKTSRLILGEFNEVLLGAGYGTEDQPRIIFKGSVNQVRRGKDSPVDKYTEILATDGDLAYTQSLVNITLPAGSNWERQRNVILGGFASGGVNTMYAPGVAEKIGPVFPRPKVYYGLVREYATRLAENMNTTWSIQNGVLTFSLINGYQGGKDEAVVLTSRTGMIGLPEQTDNGIRVQCLLNPRIVPGKAVKIDQESIQTLRTNPAYSAVNRVPSIAPDGYYKVLVVEHFGNTRENEWFTDVTCLAINPDKAATDAVKAFFAGGVVPPGFVVPGKVG